MSPQSATCCCSSSPGALPGTDLGMSFLGPIRSLLEAPSINLWDSLPANLTVLSFLAHELDHDNIEEVFRRLSVLFDFAATFTRRLQLQREVLPKLAGGAAETMTRWRWTTNPHPHLLVDHPLVVGRIPRASGEHGSTANMSSSRAESEWTTIPHSRGSRYSAYPRYNFRVSLDGSGFRISPLHRGLIRLNSGPASSPPPVGSVVGFRVAAGTGLVMGGFTLDVSVLLRGSFCIAGPVQDESAARRDGSVPGVGRWSLRRAPRHGAKGSPCGTRAIGMGGAACQPTTRMAVCHAQTQNPGPTSTHVPLRCSFYLLSRTGSGLCDPKTPRANKGGFLAIANIEDRKMTKVVEPAQSAGREGLLIWSGTVGFGIRAGRDHRE
ncbi:hypothetical protein C8F01DRAFT_1076456 [Mycena amicta]|nr:hypothetical protein C8F01DRAFT_1076456 [Mycena amicta]